MNTNAHMPGQQGSALVISLIILLIMTLIGITSMNTSVLEEKMAGNMHNRNLAFQTAESALRQGEAWIASQSVLPDVSLDGSTGIWTPATGDPLTTNTTLDPVTDNNLPWWEESTRDGSWWASNAVVTAADDSDADWIDGVAAQPAYLVEELPSESESLEAALPTDDRDMYLRVTARGTGGDGTAVVLLQSTYKW